MTNRYTKDGRLLEYDMNKSHPDIFCFSTTRHGGYGRDAYASFNCNPYCGDNPEFVEKNRELLCALMPVRPKGLAIPHQVHRTEVRTIGPDFLEKTEAGRTALLEGVDALTSDVPGICLCISTADCIPILCYDTRLKVAAAIHAGWRGTVARIAEKTLHTMAGIYGTEGKDVTVCIGPGISAEAFEVGDEVYEAFRDAGFEMSCIAVRKEKWHIDLWEANRMQLLASGVRPENIELSGICTYQNQEDFFSARRLGIRSGRILSGIMILE